MSPSTCQPKAGRRRLFKVKAAPPAKTELSKDSLRHAFGVLGTRWHLYRRANGTVGIQADTKRGVHNMDQALKNGAKLIGIAIGVSRDEAIRAAKLIKDK